MSITRSSLWFGEQVIPAEVLGSEDAYGGVIIDMKEPMDSDLFASVLRTSISQWRQQEKTGIWIKLPIELVKLVEAAVKEGFRYHHAEPSYLILVKWIPETENTLPVDASSQVAFGAFITNSKEEIETQFLKVLPLRKSPNSVFGIDCVCILKPLSFDIQKPNSEIAAAKWMPLEEFAAQPFIQKHEQFSYIAMACLEKDDNYTGFSAVPTATGFPSKTNYFFVN